MSEIKNLSSFCYKIANEGGQLAGSVIVVPVVAYEKLLLEMGKEAVVGFEYLGARVIPKQDAFEYEFIPNDLGISLNEEEQKILNDSINSEIVKMARVHYEKVQSEVIESLKNLGITFSNKKAFIEFCKTQLVNTKIGNQNSIQYQGKEIYSFTDIKIFSNDKNN